MTWIVSVSARAQKFLDYKGSPLSERQMLELVRKAGRKCSGEQSSVDVKKLKGELGGLHRIRKGKVRIIVAFDFEANMASVEVIDWRGNVYR